MLLSKNKMCAFFANCHVRSDSPDDVAKVLECVSRTRAYVSAAENGWVSVYTESSWRAQNYREINHIARELSCRLSTAVFVFIVDDTIYLLYKLYDRGELLDKYNSQIDELEYSELYYFGEEVEGGGILKRLVERLRYGAKVPEAERNRFRGQPDVLLPYCVPGTELQTVAGWFHPVDMSEEERNRAETAWERYAIYAEGPGDEELFTRWMACLFEADRFLVMARFLGIKKDRARIDFMHFEEGLVGNEAENFRLVGTAKQPNLN